MGRVQILEEIFKYLYREESNCPNTDREGKKNNNNNEPIDLTNEARVKEVVGAPFSHL